MVKVFLSPKEKGRRVANALFLSGRTATEVNLALGQTNAYMTRVTLARRQSTQDEEYWRIAEQLAGSGHLHDRTVDEIFDYFTNADIEWDIAIRPRTRAERDGAALGTGSSNQMSYYVRRGAGQRPANSLKRAGKREFCTITRASKLVGGRTTLPSETLTRPRLRRIGDRRHTKARSETPMRCLRADS